MHLEPGTADEALRMRLQELDIWDSPPYEAVSYCWGTDRDTQHILCGGRPIGITQNLFLALRQFRQPTAARTLWVDAVCIDQENIDERGRQVQVMGEIYRRSRCTLVWLGPADGDTGPAYALLRKMKEQIGSVDSLVTPSASSDDLWLPAGCSFDHVKAFSRLCAREYWSRAWVCQEFALSPRTLLYCGTFVIWRNSFQAAFRKLYAKLFSARKFGFEVRYLDWLDVLEPIGAPNRVLTLTSQLRRDSVIGILDGLLPMRFMRASDPRDYVFAMLGLVDEAARSIVVTNYEQSIEVVYKELAWGLLENSSRPFDVFGCIGYCTNHLQNGLPSWVPDWREQSSPWSFQWRSKGGPLLTSKDNFKQASRAWSPLHGYILIKGIEVTRIQRVIHPVFDKQTRARIDAVFQDITKRGNLALPAGGPLPVAARPQGLWFSKRVQGFFKDLRDLGDAACEKDRDHLWRTVAISGYHIHMQELLNGWEQVWNSLASGCDLKTNTTSEALGLVAMASFMPNLRAWELMSFCLTEDRRLALAPREAVEGDVVCVFQGAHIPHLLRPVDGEDRRYHLLGECYIHSLVDGEANALDLPVETIWIF